MKKLLSVVLVLAMLASMCVYLPMGVTAAETRATTIYAEDFTGKDGTYTLGELADELGWDLLRGDETAEATISGGKLTIDTTALDTDVVFEMATSTALKANHTYQYDLTMGNPESDLFFAAIYTGTDNGTTTKAVIDKQTYEGYNHMALVNGSINEGNIYSSGFKIAGTDHSQARGENTLYGGGYSSKKSATTWKVVFDVTNNQVDAYASGTRLNSTAGNNQWKSYNVGDYAGEGAYLRVQKGRVATFDNISFVTGGSAVSYGDYAYAQDFSNIANGTYTGAQLAQLTGFQSFADTTSNATMVYKIQNGRMEILANGTCTNSYTFKNNPQFATLYVPEMETAKDTVVIEYDMTYLYDANAEGSANSGDAPFGIEMYGRRWDFHAFWQISQKGFPQWGFYKGSYAEGGTTYYPTQSGIKNTNSATYPQNQARWEHVAYNGKAVAYNFSNSNGYGHSLYGSTENIRVVMSVKNGMNIYVNGVIAVQLTAAQLEAWTTTKGGGDASHIIGNILRFHIPAGCHFALDNIKISTDPVADYGLRITEWNCGVTAAGYCTQGGSEYLEIYNSSMEPINIYDYAVVQVAPGNSMDSFGSNVAFDNIHLAYPGTHTFKSIKLADDGINPLYTYDVTNPSYADGWLQPGEVAMLWNKTDSMHNGGYSSPSVTAQGCGNWGKVTVDMFRAGLSLDRNVKVFQMYNDYNRAFNNSGDWVVALVDRTDFQPNYNPATNSGAETLVPTPLLTKNIETMVFNYQAYPAQNYVANTTKASTYSRFAYPETTAYGSVALGTLASTGVAANMTPGKVDADQGRSTTITVDGSAKATYLGAAYSYAYTSTDTAAPNFYKDLFAVVDGEIVMADDPAYGTIAVTGNNVIQRYKLAMTSVPGVGVRFGGTRGGEAAAGLRWITGVKTAHIDELMNSGLVAGVEIGTLMTKEGDLSIDNVTADNGADGKTNRKIAAYQGYWFDETANASYANMVFFAGGVGKMMVENYDVNYKGIGYATITMNNGDTITVYGDTESANNVVDIATEALEDPDNGLTPDEVDLLNLYLEQFEQA